jgi:SAM-dependent methyltransferase
VNPLRNDKEGVAKMFNQVASIYADASRPLAHFLPYLEEFLAENVQAGKRVLDVGCGPGHFTSGLPMDVDVVGIDISPAMIDAARQSRPSGMYLVHDFHHPLPTELGKFDVVLASGCFDFCEDLTEVIGNIAAVLADGGRFYFTVSERRTGLPFHDARSIDATAGLANIQMFFWTFYETATALEASSLRPITYRFAQGWENTTLQTTIFYGYWVVEHSEHP